MMYSVPALSTDATLLATGCVGLSEHPAITKRTDKNSEHVYNLLIVSSLQRYKTMHTELCDYAYAIARP